MQDSLNKFRTGELLLRSTFAEPPLRGVGAMWWQLGSVFHSHQQSNQDRLQKEGQTCVQDMEGLGWEVRPNPCQKHSGQQICPGTKERPQWHLAAALEQAPRVARREGCGADVFLNLMDPAAPCPPNYIQNLQDWELFRVWDSAELLHTEEEETEHNLQHHTNVSADQTKSLMYPASILFWIHTNMFSCRIAQVRSSTCWSLSSSPSGGSCRCFSARWCSAACARSCSARRETSWSETEATENTQTCQFDQEVCGESVNTEQQDYRAEVYPIPTPADWQTVARLVIMFFQG